MANNRHRRVSRLKIKEEKHFISKVSNSCKAVWDSFVKTAKIIVNGITQVMYKVAEDIKVIFGDNKVYQTLAKEYSISTKLVKVMFDRAGGDVTIAKGRKIIDGYFGLD